MRPYEHLTQHRGEVLAWDRVDRALSQGMAWRKTRAFDQDGIPASSRIHGLRSALLLVLGTWATWPFPVSEETKS
jgi:hypothetical protein